MVAIASEQPPPRALVAADSFIARDGVFGLGGVLAGWYTTEIGRQPWLVYGVLTTAQAAGPVPAPTIALTLAIYIAMYLALVVAYVATVFRLAQQHGRKALQQRAFG